jgi:DNA mismatch repair protein MutS2
MDRETLDLLEFSRVLEIIEGRAETSAGKAEIRAIQPCGDPVQARTRLSQIQEAGVYLSQNGRVSCGHLGDPGPILDALASNSSVLKGSDLLTVLQLLKFVSEAKKALVPEEWPSLAELFSGVLVPAELAGRLEEALDENGELRESAFPDLAKARRQQSRSREKVQDHLSRFLRGSNAKHLISEPYITQRAERYVVPVRVENQKNIPGIVHGASSSGATVFLEPLSAVELNNQYIYARGREAEIFQQIMEELTRLTRTYHQTLLDLMSRIARLDAVFSCADFSLRFRCSSPELVTEREIKITGARHPLLIQTLGCDNVVPLTVELTSTENVLVISGPNNGGKTVALKTVGLFCAMAQAGLPVPAVEARLPLLKNILADVGDHQSIIQHLSTFSSHIKRINELLDNRLYPCLMLLDEAGRGTDPVYGAALAVSIIEHFRGRETLVIATTHHRGAKAYASSTTGVKNASVQLDSDSLKPTYVLEFGVAGSSGGLEIAQQLGLRKEIIAHARRLLETKELEVETYLRELRQQLKTLEQRDRRSRERLEEIERRKKTLETRVAEQESKRAEEFEEKLKQWAQEFRFEASRYVRRMKDRFAAAKTKEEAKKRETALKEAFRRKMKSTATSELRSKPAEKIVEGDTVYHTLFETQGVVLSLDQSGASVEIGGKKVNTPLDKLRKVTGGGVTRKLSEKVTLNVVEDSDPELNLVGMTVDEAVGVLDKFLDRAFVSGLKEVKVIHGLGTGKLRTAVSQILSEHPHVDSHGTKGGATTITLSQ